MGLLVFNINLGLTYLSRLETANLNEQDLSLA
jgi:hypothetical protein